MANLLVLVSYKVFPAHMGGQKGVVKFYEYLKKHHNIYLALSFDNPLNEIQFQAEKLLYPNRKMSRNLLQLPQLVKLVHQKKIDCIVAEHSYTGWVAYLLKKTTGKPFIIHSHNIEASRFRQMGRRGWMLYGRYEGWVHRKANFSFFKTADEKRFALAAYRVNPSKTAVVPYGVDEMQIVSDAGKKLRLQFNITTQFIFYFNGTMDYEPNSEAVEILIGKLNPLLLESGLDFTILISGKRLPKDLQKQIAATTTIHYLDFVDDVETLYQGSDLFLNPVVNNAGVKTKLVEAIANHCSVVSTDSGASGVSPELCGRKLVTVHDNDWAAFAAAVIQHVQQQKTRTPAVFFDSFLWRNIAQHAAKVIDTIVSHA